SSTPPGQPRRARGEGRPRPGHVGSPPSEHRGGPVGELTPEDDDAGAPPWIVGTPLVRRNLVRRDLFEPETLEELPRPLIHSAGEDVVEALALRIRHEVGDQPLAYPFALEARDGVEANDLAGALPSVRCGHEARDTGEMMGGEAGTHARGQDLSDLLGGALL